MNNQKNRKAQMYQFEGKTDPYVFTPQALTLADDAFHSSTSLQFTEWWYFDAVLHNGYSVQFSVRVLSGLKLSLVFVRFDMYKDGHLMVHKTKMHLLRDVKLSRETPHIQVAGKQIMNGTLDKKTGDFIYNISLTIDELTASLQFIGCSKGWKGQHYGGDWWAVVLPQAMVSGSVIINDERIDVQGTGYHDHNWDVQIFALKNLGWFWGKLNSETYSMNWAAIMKTRSCIQPVLIINEKHKGYIPIQPKNIDLQLGDVRRENGKSIPHRFSIDAEGEQVVFHVSMKTIDTHFVRIFPFMRYWRYHLQCTGSITVGAKQEPINNVFIAEFLKIR